MRTHSHTTPCITAGEALLGAAALLALAVMVWWLTSGWPAWIAMWMIAAAEFFAIKGITLGWQRGIALPGRAFAYVALWPGMDAPAFFEKRCGSSARPGWGEASWAATKMAFGFGLLALAVIMQGHWPDMVVGWTAMVGIIFVLHFGMFHLLSCAWRTIGVEARPIMSAPIAATSLADFWGWRWNAAFADAARRFLFLPLCRKFGSNLASAGVFLFSGLIHEAVISLPARGGWGGPTAYFLIQAIGMGLEKTVIARKLGLSGGATGWAWTLVVTAAPLPLLFHTPFVERIIFPLLDFLGG